MWAVPIDCGSLIIQVHRPVNRDCEEFHIVAGFEITGKEYYSSATAESMTGLYIQKLQEAKEAIIRDLDNIIKQLQIYKKDEAKKTSQRMANEDS